MKRLTKPLMLLSFLTFLTISSDAQWEPFLLEETVFYHHNSIWNVDEIHAIEWSHSEVLLDREVYFPTSHIDCPSCNDHWVGAKVEVFPNGDHIFYSGNQDTCLIKGGIPVGMEWEVMTRGSSKLMGKCVSSSFKEILGEFDSVQTIEFHMVDLFGEPVGHQIDGTKIELSKNHGYVEFLPFSVFPDGFIYQGVDHIPTISLVGTTRETIGYLPVQWRDVINLEVGDEFHILEYGGSYDLYTGTGWDSTQKMIQTVIEKEETTEEIVYRIAVQNNYEYFDFFELVDSAIFKDTIEIRYPKFNIVFDYLPNVRYLCDGFEAYNLDLGTIFRPQ